jgi:dihydrofolate reductase
MRKLKLQMQTSIDGFPQYGANDEQHWVIRAWDEIKNYILDLANSCDTEIIGRRLAVDYIPYWLEANRRPDNPMYELAKIKVSQKKIVFSKSLDKSLWDNTELAKGDLVDEVYKLKKQNGKDIIVYGGTTFVSELISSGLIDKYHLFLNPVILGKKGVPIFDKLESYRQLKLKRSLVYDCGIVLLHYEPKR